VPKLRRIPQIDVFAMLFSVARVFGKDFPTAIGNGSEQLMSTFDNFCQRRRQSQTMFMANHDIPDWLR